uniref:Uncharacterized protein n=1 Tax=Rhodnius prolixus TaxID=13249 RepID=T1I9P5_RHOPR
MSFTNMQKKYIIKNIIKKSLILFERYLMSINLNQEKESTFGTILISMWKLIEV